MTALLTFLVALALLGGACANGEDRTGTESEAAGTTGDTSSPPEEPAPPTTEPSAIPPPADPPPTPGPPETAPAPEEPAPRPPTDPPAPPEPPATTRAAEESAPPAAAEDPESAPTVSETAPAETTDPPEPPAASELPDREQAAGDGAAPAATESLPGEPYEYGPDEGTLLSVVGVPHDEVLNLHDAPAGEVIATLDISNPYESQLKVTGAPSGEVIASFDEPTGGIVATGRTRNLPDTAWPEAVWDEVRVAGLTGWARAAYLAPVGLTDDLTAHLIERLGERPEADTLIGLGLVVGKAMASQEPPSHVRIVTRPIVFEALGEVTVDVLNIGDDSLLGYRLHVFATPAAEDWMSEDPGPFALRTVERTVLCYSARGVTADGLCN